MKKRLLSEMPKELNDKLSDSKLNYGKVLVYAQADMNEACDFCDSVLILCEDCLIFGKSTKTNNGHKSGKMLWNISFEDFTFDKYDLSVLSSPAVDLLVVGGIFRVNVESKEKVLCTFTNSCKGRINKLCGILKDLLDNKEIKEERLSEEEHEEFCPKCGTPYPDRNRKVCPQCMDKRKIFFRLASFFTPFKKELIIICIICILGSLMSSVWPLLNGTYLYDGVLAKNNTIFPFSAFNVEDFFLLLLFLALAMAGTKLLQQVFGIIQGRLVAKIVPSVVNTLKKKVFSSIQRLSVSFFTDKQTGGLMSRITQDATQVSDIFIDGIPFILPNLFTIIFSCYFMFKTNSLLALTAIITLPPALIISVKLEPILWHYNSRQFQTSVVLPAPDFPTIPSILPCFTLRVISLSTSRFSS